jgi:hypothetical protein
MPPLPAAPPAQVAVFEEGWAGDKFYILLHGKLRVFKGEVQLALTLTLTRPSP